MKIVEVGTGIKLVEIPESGLSILCGCPENAYKLLKRAGLIEKVEGGGRTWESGPNAILLSEFPVQGGRFCNLIEFPVLQMLYRQGMIIPGHPNNRGERPLLIGHRDDLEAMARYVHLGNYGLANREALVEAGLGEEAADELLAMKRHFAFGSFRSTEELLEFRVIEGPAIELRKGSFLRRLGPNRYQIFHGAESVEVDLSLPAGASYPLPYELPRRSFSREQFSVVHIGEGDGWDVDRPCMSSLVVHRGRVWLVDAGPNVRESLAALGLGSNDLEGVFVTHAHDDHVVGLTALLQSERRLRFLAVPWVRATVEGKLEALAGLDSEVFREIFAVRDLGEGEWNDVEGLEVMPFLSPHPVETTCMRFRAHAGSDQRSYAHLADLSSFAVIDAMTRNGSTGSGISPSFAERSKAAYLEAADLKKIDSGGGMIHGEALDFRGDSSGDLILSHREASIPLPSGVRGRVAEFGEESVLIPGREDYRRETAMAFLGREFPAVPRAELDNLLAREPLVREEGALFADRGRVPEEVELLLSGLIRYEGGESGAAGSLVGEAECLAGEVFVRRIVCATRVESLPIGAEDFRSLVSRFELDADRARRNSVADFLHSSPLFSELALTSSIHELAGKSVLVAYEEGEEIGGPGSALYVLASGSVRLRAGGVDLPLLGPGDVFGEETVLAPGEKGFEIMAVEDCGAYLLPSEDIRSVPHLLWKLRELRGRRLAAARRGFDYRWRSEYTVGEAELDGQHAELFALLDELAAEVHAPEACRELGPQIERLRPFFVKHFETEEGLMERASYAGLEHQRSLHRSFLAKFDDWARQVACGDRHLARDFGDFLTDWLIHHTLGVDRAYAGKLGVLGAGANLIDSSPPG